MSENENSTSYENEENKKMRHSHTVNKDCGMMGGVYGMAFIGAAIYFIQHAETFWMGVLGFLKALVWPALLIYKLLEFLKM